jgi:uncharacterized repeat protein (TIGR01451 family)
MITSTPIQTYKRILVLLTACMLQFSCALVFAADDNVTVALHAFKVSGQKLIPTTEAQPGDTLEYQVTYRNAGATPARNVMATLPVPDGGMHYVANSAAPARVLASLDGKQYAPVPLTRTVVRNNQQQTETVPVAEYRFLRWQLGDIAPGSSVQVSSRMRLEGALKQQ